MSSLDPPLDDRTQTLLRGLRNSGLCVMQCDTGLIPRLIENAPANWPPVEMILALGDAAIFDTETAERIAETKHGVLSTGTPARLEVARRIEGQDTHWYELHVEADRASHPDGLIRGLFVSITEITELKNREEALRALLYEVSHRSRNLLAILQSVLGHTARSSDSIATFERKFRGRIAALAHSQDLITRSNWQGVRFHRLVMNQLADHLPAGSVPPPILGPDPLINPNTALHLGLALHELAANSASYGAIAQGSGKVVIETYSTPAGQSMMWRETLAKPREAPVASGGFGRAILTQIVPRAVNGTADYAITPESVSYRVTWPEAVAL